MGKVIMSGIVPLLTKPVAGILASDLAVGSVVKLMEGGTAVEYLVVNQGIPSNSNLYDSSCNGTWLLRKDIHSKRVWNTSSDTIYRDSAINDWLNGDFFDSFGSSEKIAIKQVKIPDCSRSGGSEVNTGTNGMQCKTFLLSAYELGWTTSDSKYLVVDGAVVDYFKGLAKSDSKRNAYYNGSIVSYWTRSPTTYTDQSVVWALSAFGYQNSPRNEYGIRPVVIVPKTALFDETTLILKGVA